MKNVIVLSISVFFTTAVFAQVKINAELKTLINQSFTYFPKVKEIENTLNTAEEKLQLTTLNKMPDVSFSTAYNFIMPKISFPINGKEFQFAPTNNIAASVGSSYTLFDFGRLKATIVKSKTDIQVAKDNIQLVKSQLANQISVIYYNIVYLQKAMSIQDSVINYFKENKMMVENKVKSGEMINIDVLNLQANIDGEENKKIDLNNSLKNQFSLLEFTTGSKITSGNIFDFNIDAINSVASVDVAQQNNPEFQLAKDKILLAQKEVNIVKLNSKPTIGLHAATGFRNGFVPEVNNLKFNYMAGFTFSLPIYSFGKTKEQIKFQQGFVKQNELAQISLTSNYKKDIEQSMIDVNTNIERIKNTESQLAATKMAQQLTTARYKNGVATYLDVTAAATNVQKAALSHLQYEYQLCLAKIELAKLLGYQFWNN